MSNPPLEIKIMRARSHQKTVDAMRYAAALYYKKENMKMDNKEKILKEIEEAKQNIEELQENIKNLEEQLNKEPSKWKPKKDDYFYYISDIGTVETDINTEHRFDIAKIEMGNCFKTKEEAKFELEKIKVRAELKKFSFEPDWNDSETKKYYIFCDTIHNNLRVDYITCMHEDLIYFDSLDAAEKAIEQVGEDRIKKYLFGRE